jgi:hypothetical protein
MEMKLHQQIASFKNGYTEHVKLRKCDEIFGYRKRVQMDNHIEGIPKTTLLVLEAFKMYSHVINLDSDVYVI